MPWFVYLSIYVYVLKYKNRPAGAECKVVFHMEKISGERKRLDVVLVSVSVSVSISVLVSLSIFLSSSPSPPVPVTFFPPPFLSSQLIQNREAASGPDSVAFQIRILIKLNTKSRSGLQTRFCSFSHKNSNKHAYKIEKRLLEQIL